MQMVGLVSCKMEDRCYSTKTRIKTLYHSWALVFIPIAVIPLKQGLRLVSTSFEYSTEQIAVIPLKQGLRHIR